MNLRPRHSGSVHMPLAGLLRNLPEWTLRRPCAGKGQGDASITAAQVLLEPEGAGGVPGSPSTPDQDPGCWDGDVLPPHLSGPFLCCEVTVFYVISFERIYLSSRIKIRSLLTSEFFSYNVALYMFPHQVTLWDLGVQGAFLRGCSDCCLCCE